MSLREILQKIIENGDSILLSDSEKDWEAGELLNGLSEAMLSKRVHLQQGLYIAEINEAGYLGSVMFRVKRKSERFDLD